MLRLLPPELLPPELPPELLLPLLLLQLLHQQQAGVGSSGPSGQHWDHAATALRLQPYSCKHRCAFTSCPRLTTCSTLPCSAPQVRIPAHCLTSNNRHVRARQLWGSDVYTEDSDLVAVLMHCGYWYHSRGCWLGWGGKDAGRVGSTMDRHA